MGGSDRIMPGIVRAALCVALVLVVLVSAAASGQVITVTLLGTGAPPPVMTRFGPSILVKAGDQTFLFDAGRGALQRLTQIGVRWQDVDGLFFTHLHSDHVVGFPDLWLTGWLVAPGRDRPLAVWGPRGTKAMMSHLEAAYEFDLRMRRSDDRASSEGMAIQAADVEPGIVFDKGGLTITAIEVDHRPVEPAFGYRIDYGGRSVVLSGDTRVSDNLIRHAQGVDLLVHEVVSPETFARAGVRPERAQSVIDHHVTPVQAGEVFAKTKPRLAVYSHIVQPIATEQDLIPPTRTTYQGALEVGEDLMVIEVGAKIAIRRPTRPAP